MNRNIRRLGLFILVMFGVIVADVTYWQVIDASSMAARSDNHRLYDQAQQIRRGRIYDRNGVLLAGRRIGTDGFVHRYYTDPSLSTVIGYDDPRLGKSELESSYDGYLSGAIAGTSWTTFLNRIEHKPVVGNDITLTIDDRIQRAVDGIMPASPSAAIVSDPRTGEILAMVSHPDFDANQVGNTAYWRSLLNDPSFPLISRTVNGYYPPGSTFKIVTLSAALDAGIYSLDSVFSGTAATGPITVGGHVYPDTINNLNDCGGRVVPPPITLEQALMCSDNIVFAQVGLKLGASRFLDYTHRFGLDSSPPFAIPVSRSRVRAGSEVLDQVALASSAFGQGGLHVTPLQMLMADEAIADGGSVPRPVLVKKVTAPDGSVIQSESPGTLSQAVSSDAADETRAAMETVVQQGTGVLAQVPGVTIAGKTGTAETGGSGYPHAWFVCFAPADHPRLAVTVVVEHGGEGATVAAPLARQILEAALPLAPK
jgi:peptidoglycan glycosyltransferase